MIAPGRIEISHAVNGGRTLTDNARSRCLGRLRYALLDDLQVMRDVAYQNVG